MTGSEEDLQLTASGFERSRDRMRPKNNDGENKEGCKGEWEGYERGGEI